MIFLKDNISLESSTTGISFISTNPAISTNAMTYYSTSRLYAKYFYIWHSMFSQFLAFTSTTDLQFTAPFPIYGIKRPNNLSFWSLNNGQFLFDHIAVASIRLDTGGDLFTNYDFDSNDDNRFYLKNYLTFDQITSGSSISITVDGPTDKYRYNYNTSINIKFLTTYPSQVKYTDFNLFSTMFTSDIICGLKTPNYLIECPLANQGLIGCKLPEDIQASISISIKCYNIHVVQKPEITKYTTKLLAITTNYNDGESKLKHFYLLIPSELSLHQASLFSLLPALLNFIY